MTGFRRNYLLRKQAQNPEFEDLRQPFTRRWVPEYAFISRSHGFEHSFVDFLSLYGHFGGEVSYSPAHIVLLDSDATGTGGPPCLLLTSSSV
jgi:hypothetical protein